MVYTLSDLTYLTALQLGVITEGTATGGSTSTIQDSVDRPEEDDDDWNGGTAWIRYDAGGAGAAPQGEYAVISDFTSVGGVITIRGTFTVAVAVGDQYAIAKPRYSLQILIQCVNMALNRLGEILIWDSATITTADNQTEYTLPSMVTKESLKEVYIQINDDDSDDNRWRLIYNWRVKEPTAGTGTAKTLILPEQYPSGYAIGLSYTSKHPPMRIYTDKLNESVSPERIYFAAAYEALIKKRRNLDAITADKIVRAQQDMLIAERDYPISIPAKTPRIIQPRRSDYIIEDEPNKVYL